MLNKRQMTIINYLSKHGEAKNSDLLELIGDFSLMTLHRDLNKLEEDGLIMRVHGGALYAPLVQNRQELAFSYRIKQNTEEKDEISRIAVDFIKPNHGYYFDAGSTLLSMSELINDDHHTIVTCAANIAVELSRNGNNTITLLGGQLSNTTLSCSGPQSEEMLQDINIDVAIMATSGFSIETGFSVGSLSEAHLKKAVIGKATHTIMLMDHSKVSKNYPFTFAAMNKVDVLIVDSIKEEVRKACQENNVLLFAPDDGYKRDERVEMFNNMLNKKFL